MTGSWFTLLGFGVGAMVLAFEARRRGLLTEGMGYIAIAALTGGAVGAKLTWWVLFNADTLASRPELIVDPRTGGRALIGGVMGGWLAVELVKRWLGIRRSTGDLFALALPAGEAVGRIGCYLNECCYGSACQLPWAVYQHDAYRHPVQLYSAAAGAVLFFVLLALRGRMTREGELFKLYLMLYGVSRFGLEFFRERNLMMGPLSLVQWICMVGVTWLAIRQFSPERGLIRKEALH